MKWPLEEISHLSSARLSDRRQQISVESLEEVGGMNGAPVGMTDVQLFVDSDRWGPYQERLLSFSFGDCSHYLVLRDADKGRPQGAVVPLPGEFESGAHRARFHPLDGQLYVVGSQGWGNDAHKDGSFERVRYTGAPTYYPVVFKVHENGIRIDFPRKLSMRTVDPERDVFAQQWNYQYSKGYGSPEFSMRHPDRLGHDRLSVRQVYILAGRQSVFVEIPDLEPAMQVHLRLHLGFDDEVRFATDLFASVLRLGSPFVEAIGLGLWDRAKPKTLELGVLETPPAVPENEDAGTPGRPVIIRAITGLKYDQTFVKVKAGERISLTLENTDVIRRALSLYQTVIEHQSNQGSVVLRYKEGREETLRFL